jgi:glyoxylase-like metal-dependent hydrolase (beta-lactamase superfamily II)
MTKTDATPIDVLRPGLKRLRAPNPGLMTGSGTNTYIVGDETVIVIDPGPAIARHVETIERNAPTGIEWIVVTHTHLDHSPAAMLLAERAGARVAGPSVPADGRQDHTFRPDRILSHGDRVTAGSIELTAIATPGHASNHLCYSLAAERELFTGDHINEGSTVVINPPDGDMTAYLDSLARVEELGRCRLLPGHGEPIDDSTAATRALIEHRLAREAKVVASLPADRAVTVDELLPTVYADVAEALHNVAAQSLLAHLLKLERDGKASRQDDRWLRV